jgi:Ser/Thr protein kinase RdoA (MazF antagonist)
MPNPFPNELHARFGVPRPLVVGLAGRATGRCAVGVERVVRGYDNEVHRVRVDDGSVVYTRVRWPRGPGDHDDRVGIQWEVWAMERAREAGVPVPAVLSTEVVDSGQGEREAMVVAAATGRELVAVLPSLSGSERRQAMADVGRVLAVVHTVETPGPWRPDDEGHWADPIRLREGFLADRAGERAELIEAGLTDEETDRIIGLLPAAWDATGPRRPVLSHGDLSPDHVFVDADLRVSAVIDWGGWHGGSALTDLARTSMLHGREDFTAIVGGYRQWPVDEPGFRRKLALSTLLQTVGYTAHHVRIGDLAGAPRSVARLRRILVELGHGGRDVGEARVRLRWTPRRLGRKEVAAPMFERFTIEIPQAELDAWSLAGSDRGGKPKR